MNATPQFNVLTSRPDARSYFQSLLTSVASIVLVGFVLVFKTAFRGWASEHAPGLTAVAGGVMEGAMSLYGGLIFLAWFTFFYITSHSAKRWIRVVLFWAPASLATALGLALWALMAGALRTLPQ